MHSLRTLFVGPPEIASPMSSLLCLRKFDSHWESTESVTPEDVKQADVLIADIGLRGQEGREFVLQLVAKTRKRPLVVVIGNETEVPPRQPGIDAYLRKPVDPDQFVALLDRFQSFHDHLRG
jgi:DNA-binding response OmpR family regulator